MSLKNPNEKGRFGPFGGRYIPETLVPACNELEKSFIDAWSDDSFRKELDSLLADYAGRPSPITECFNLSAELNCRLLLKREDLNHTGSHKINNVLGQALLAKRMGKKRLVAETGAGKHGVATATAAALLNMECCVYMGEVDVQRQELNVFRMKLLGAEVKSVESGSKTLKDAVNDAMRDWVATVEESYYCLGSVMGPHPYPWMVRTFHEVIGTEARKQSEEILGTVPDVVCACIGGGSNALGLFYPFLNEKKVKIIGIEAAGKGINTNKHAASLSKGKPGFLHGNYTYLLQDNDGQILDAHSISAGLDYPGIGPEHSWLKETGRVQYYSSKDNEDLNAFKLCCNLEGIIPALEPSHALAFLLKYKKKLTKNTIVVMNMCGRGDKDIFAISKNLGFDL